MLIFETLSMLLYLHMIAYKHCKYEQRKLQAYKSKCILISKAVTIKSCVFQIHMKLNGTST